MKYVASPNIKSRRTASACVSCRKSKRRCTGVKPCPRCIARGEDCADGNGNVHKVDSCASSFLQSLHYHDDLDTGTWIPVTAEPAPMRSSRSKFLKITTDESRNSGDSMTFSGDFAFGMSHLDEAPKSSTDSTRSHSLTSPKDKHEYPAGTPLDITPSVRSASSHHAQTPVTDPFLPTRICVTMRLSDDNSAQILQCNAEGASIYGKYLLEQHQFADPFTQPYHPFFAPSEEFSLVLSDFHRFILQYASCGRRYVRIGMRFFEETFVVEANCLWHCTYVETNHWEDSLYVEGHNKQVLLNLGATCSMDAQSIHPHVCFTFAMRISAMLQRHKMQVEYGQHLKRMQREAAMYGMVLPNAF